MEIQKYFFEIIFCKIEILSHTKEINCYMNIVIDRCDTVKTPANLSIFKLSNLYTTTTRGSGALNSISVGL